MKLFNKKLYKRLEELESKLMEIETMTKMEFHDSRYEYNPGSLFSRCQNTIPVADAIRIILNYAGLKIVKKRSTPEHFVIEEKSNERKEGQET